MAITVLTHHTDRLWSAALMDAALMAMPAAMRERIMAYRQPEDRQARLAGKLLLRQIFARLGLAFTLQDVQYTTGSKPYVKNGPDFSITHTKGIVACTCSSSGSIGIDAEHIREISLTDYRDLLTDGEWNVVNDSRDYISFWDIWTRKEAIAKASGQGVNMRFETVDTRGDTVSVGGAIFHLYKIDPSANFRAHIAVSEGAVKDKNEISIREINNETLLAMP